MNYNKDQFTFEIPNFHKYHPKKEYKSIPWIRFDVNFFQDPTVARLGAVHAAFYVYLLTVCGRFNSDSATVSIRLAAVSLHLKPVQVRNAVDSLEENQLITVLSRSWGDPKNIPTKRNGTNETKRTERTKREVNSPSGEIDTPPPPKKSKPRSHWLVEMWNEKGGRLPPCRIPISESRLKKIQARVKQAPLKEPWIEAIERLSKSNFANGLNDRSWVATFDWLLKPDSFEKILEGKYDNRPTVDRKTMEMAEQRQRMLGDDHGGL